MSYRASEMTYNIETWILNTFAKLGEMIIHNANISSVTLPGLGFCLPGASNSLTTHQRDRHVALRR